MPGVTAFVFRSAKFQFVLMYAKMIMKSRNGSIERM
jgi:hypothetical protein